MCSSRKVSRQAWGRARAREGCGPPWCRPDAGAQPAGSGSVILVRTDEYSAVVRSEV
jgi:hypothetical protein